VARLDFGRLHPLYLDDVIAERGFHRIRDDPRLEPKSHPLEFRHHDATAEPVERAALVLRSRILREPACRGGEVGSTA
jgi:hypothetical protein